jgi:hypothetical protein
VDGVEGEFRGGKIKVDDDAIGDDRLVAVTLPRFRCAG